MDEVKGEIEDMVNKFTGKGTPYILIRMNGEGYFVWEPKMVEDYDIGDSVIITHNASAYPKVTSIRKSEGSLSNPDESDVQPTRSDEPSPFHKMQFRSHALISASNVSSVKEPAEDILKKARLFYKYITEGK